MLAFRKIISLPNDVDTDEKNDASFRVVSEFFALQSTNTGGGHPEFLLSLASTSTAFRKDFAKLSASPGGSILRHQSEDLIISLKGKSSIPQEEARSLVVFERPLRSVKTRTPLAERRIAMAEPISPAEEIAIVGTLADVVATMIKHRSTM